MSKPGVQTIEGSACPQTATSGPGFTLPCWAGSPRRDCHRGRASGTATHGRRRQSLRGGWWMCLDGATVASRCVKAGATRRKSSGTGCTLKLAVLEAAHSGKESDERAMHSCMPGLTFSRYVSDDLVQAGGRLQAAGQLAGRQRGRQAGAHLLGGRGWAYTAYQLKLRTGVASTCVQHCIAPQTCRHGWRTLLPSFVASRLHWRQCCRAPLATLPALVPHPRLVIWPLSAASAQQLQDGRATNPSGVGNPKNKGRPCPPCCTPHLPPPAGQKAPALQGSRRAGCWRSGPAGGDARRGGAAAESSGQESWLAWGGRQCKPAAC